MALSSRAHQSLTFRATAAVAGVAPALGAFVMLAPLVAAAAVAVALVAYVAVRYPKVLVVGAVGTALFSQTLVQVTGSSLVGYADEGGVALCVVCIGVRRLLSNKALCKLPGAAPFAVLMAAGVISAIAGSVPWSTTAVGALLVAKPALLGWSIAQVEWRPEDLGWMKRLAKIGALVLLAGAAVQFVAPEPWAAVFTSAATPDARSELSIASLQSLFVHPSFFAQVMALFAVSALAWRQEVSQSGGLWVLVASVAAALSLRRKTLLSLPLGLLRVRLTARRGLVAILVALICLPVALLMAAPVAGGVLAATYDTYVRDASENPRARITLDSITIATEHAPLGVGFGRFGSSTAFANYSPEYVARGYQSLYGLDPDTGRFATDTFWPAILGEAGYLGAVAFAVALLMTARAFRRATRSTTPWMRFLGVAGSGWLTVLLIESVAAPVFTGPPTYPLLFGLAGLVAALDEHAPTTGTG